MTNYHRYHKSVKKKPGLTLDYQSSLKNIHNLHFRKPSCWPKHTTVCFAELTTIANSWIIDSLTLQLLGQLHSKLDCPRSHPLAIQLWPPAPQQQVKIRGLGREEWRRVLPLPSYCVIPSSTTRTRKTLTGSGGRPLSTQTSKSWGKWWRASETQVRALLRCSKSYNLVKNWYSFLLNRRHVPTIQQETFHCHNLVRTQPIVLKLPVLHWIGNWYWAYQSKFEFFRGCVLWNLE